MVARGPHSDGSIERNLGIALVKWRLLEYRHLEFLYEEGIDSIYDSSAAIHP